MSCLALIYVLIPPLIGFAGMLKSSERKDLPSRRQRSPDARRRAIQNARDGKKEQELKEENG